MNLESLPRPETIHVSAPAALNRPPSQTLPQRSPFAIQELLGLSSSNNSDSRHNGGNGAVSAVTPSALYSAAAAGLGQSPFPSDHHGLSMAAASRMAYFNAHAAVAAAFLPNMSGSGGPLVGLGHHHHHHHHQTGGESTAEKQQYSRAGRWTSINQRYGLFSVGLITVDSNN